MSRTGTVTEGGRTSESRRPCQTDLGTPEPPSTIIASRCTWLLWQTSFVPDDWSDRRDALPQGCVLRDYTIEEVLGHGGFGIVYKARHNELDHIVAIKEYLPSELAVRERATIRAKSAECETHFAEGLRCFREEAKALIEFQQHSSIVDCREFFRLNGTAYLVIEYVDGLPLSELLREREAAGQPFRESDLLAIAKPLAEGLAHVHRAGVIHRDIKPSNILVRRSDGQPVLIDFGAAKQAVAEHSRSLAPYTEGYAALEQIADGQLGPWTDLYGFGAVLWRMVAGGNRPWDPPNPVKVESRANARVREADDPLPTAMELGAGRFSSRVLEVIDGCLQLRDTERIRETDRVVFLLGAGGGENRQPATAEPPPSGLAEAGRPPTKQTRANRHERTSPPVPAVPAAGSGWRRGGGLVLTSLVVGFGLVLATRWDSGPKETPTQREVGASWTNSLGMEFAWIPAGRFLMGSPEDEEGRFPGERQREVGISEGYWIKKHEVTQGEWVTVMGTNPSEFSSCGPRCPVENASWRDMQELIRRLNALDAGRAYGYRLPTEAEWEYAARAGTTGARYGELDAIAWHGHNSGYRTHPVGQKRANAWGLHDMLGNVWEWTGDRYGGYPFGSVTDPRGPESGSYRVIRGGGQGSDAREVRSANRFNSDEYSLRPGHRYFNIGFRLVRTE